MYPPCQPGTHALGHRLRRATKKRPAARSSSDKVLGSGIAGTVCGFTGVSPVSSYCCAFSKTTAPLTGVTI
jgi:hypothetical protein